jgi:hypothetical protein
MARLMSGSLEMIGEGVSLIAGRFYVDRPFERMQLLMIEPFTDHHVYFKNTNIQRKKREKWQSIC